MLKYISGNLHIEEDVNSFIVCGDPGCDGFNAIGTSIYEYILRHRTDFTFVVGDLVPYSNENTYNEFINITNTSSVTSVFCLPGNHDILDYEKFIGKKDYYIKTNNTLFVMLDNSKRFFSEESFEFLRKTLKEQCNLSTFIFFHIPPQNPFTDNNFCEEQWEILRDILLPYKGYIRYIFTGHIHKSIEYELDGFNIVITGGAGSEPDTISKLDSKVEYHYYHVSVRKGRWDAKIMHVHHKDLATDKTDNKNLISGYTEESKNHLSYNFYAEEADREGYQGIARLFRAISNSKKIHAKNMLISSGELSNTMDNLDAVIEQEKYDLFFLYPSMMASEEHELKKKGYIAFKSALTAEKVHYKLLTEAKFQLGHGKDFHYLKYYVCQRCGYLHHGDEPITFCPGCGAGRYFFKEV